MMYTCPHLRQSIQAGIPLLAATLLAFAPDAYLPMLARSFMLPATLLLVAMVLGALVWRTWWVALSALAGAGLLSGVIITPYAFVSSSKGAHDLRVFHMNVLQPNRAFDEAIAQALASDADVISVQEVSPQWAAALHGGLGVAYPYACIEPRTNCYGIALFSRIPLLDVRLVEVKAPPMVEACIVLCGRTVRLLAIHATSPGSYADFRERNTQLAWLGWHLAQDDTTTIVMGDLNTVPWDDAFGRLCGQARLRSTTPPFHTTWPVVGPLAVIPLDHVLVSPGISCTTLRTMRVSGSDHRGLMVDLQL